MVASRGMAIAIKAHGSHRQGPRRNRSTALEAKPALGHVRKLSLPLNVSSGVEG